MKKTAFRFVTLLIVGIFFTAGLVLAAELDTGLHIFDGTQIVKVAAENPPISPLRIFKNGVIYGLALVDLTSPNATKIRIKTANQGIKALKKFSTCLNLTIVSNVNNYNIRTAANAAGWTSGPVCLTINSGVTVWSNSTAQAALDTGSFLVGTVITIVNNGSIIGAGGNGGNADGGSGGNGGNAMKISIPVSINNMGGNIFGGGGGGGGGGPCFVVPFVPIPPPSGGGLGGIGNLAGSTGSNARFAGNGGAGGGYGQAGSPGAPPVTNCISGGPGGPGGAAGKAVNTSGNAVTWLGGNNPTQVRGAVN